MLKKKAFIMKTQINLHRSLSYNFRNTTEGIALTLSEFIEYHSDPLVVLFSQDVVEERGFSSSCERDV